MNRMTRKFLMILLLGLLAACAGPRPKAVNDTTPSPAPTLMKHAPNAMTFPFPPRPPGERTVADVLQDFGPYATNQLKPYFAQAGVAFPPQEITLVALKAEKKLELWARGDADYRHIRDYEILAASGTAGPKLRQGDQQVPEGVYRIIGLNPNSKFHLSMKLNYPNEFDLFHASQEGRFNPGSDIFIHGKDLSVGCLAMGDAAIEELFVLVAQTGADRVKVVITPRDPRILPLRGDDADLPPWTEELYSWISGEILALNRPPFAVSQTSVHGRPHSGYRP